MIAVFGDAVSTNQSNYVSIQETPEYGAPAQPYVPGYPNGNFRWVCPDGYSGVCWDDHDNGTADSVQSEAVLC
jgi:hypothetical protein